MSDTIVNVLFKQGVLFDLGVGAWQATHKMQPEDLRIEKLNREAMYIGHKKLLPAEIQEKFSHQDYEIRKFLRQNSAPFPIAGAVFVPYKTLPKIIKGLEALKKDYEALVDWLITYYDQLKTNQLQTLDQQVVEIVNQQLAPYPVDSDQYRAKYYELVEWRNAQWKANEALYPPKDKLKDRYYVVWRMFKVDPVGSEAVTGEQAQALAEAQAKLQKELQDWVKAQTVKMHQALGKAAAKAKLMLEKQGKLNPKNLKPLFDTFETFKASDFANSSFGTAIDKLKQELAVGDTTTFESLAEQVNNSQQQFSALLDQFTELAVDDVAEKAGIAALGGTEFKRVIDL